MYIIDRISVNLEFIIVLSTCSVIKNSELSADIYIWIPYIGINDKIMS